MNNKQKNTRRQFLQLTDCVLVVLAILLANGAWNNLLVDWIHSLALFSVEGRYIPGLRVYGSWLFLVAPFIPLCLEQFGFYNKLAGVTRGEALITTLKAHLIVIGAIALFSVLFKTQEHRPTLFLSGAFSAGLITIREWLMIARARKKVTSGKGLIRTALVGEQARKTEWWDKQSPEIKTTHEIIVQYDLSSDKLSELGDLLSEKSIEKAIVLPEFTSFNLVGAAVEECEIRGVDVWVASDFVRARICQPVFDMIGNTPMLVLRSTPSLSWSLLAKDLLDKLGAPFLILLTSPFWVLAYIGIKLRSPGPVFYKQPRAGKYGKSFDIWKFRTMNVDADKKLEELKKEQGNEMSGPVFKLEEDPRIFPFGQFMRKFSIDELPQLINVLRGEMSLVGPRPMAMYELPMIEKSEHRRKLSVKPGMTCIWQVEGRNTITDFHEWVALDLKYIDNWSIWLDIQLLLKTIPAVFLSRGAS